MMPSLELRLRTLAKAMTDVILPALPAQNALAREQAQLLVAQLGMIAKHWRRAAEFDAIALREIVALAERLVPLAAGGPRTQAAAGELAALLAGRAQSARALDEDRAAVAAAIDALIAASAVDGDDPFRCASGDAIVAYSALQAWRDRVWFAGFGMDPERARLPEIDDMLAQARPSRGSEPAGR